MRQIKIILKYFDILDNEFNNECLSIDQFISKIDKEIDDEWNDFKKTFRVKFSIIDEKGRTISKDDCDSEHFKKESIILKNKMS